MSNKDLQSMETTSRAKTFEDHKEHFTERLLERYDIQLKPGQYEQVCQSKFHGLIKKSAHKTVGSVEINGTKVWVLYYPDFPCFATCYPPEIETDLFAALRTVFGPSVRKIAFRILMQYLEEAKTLPKFTDLKTAAIWLFENSIFPQLHIEVYKYGSVAPLRVMSVINRITNNEIPFVQLLVLRKPK